MKRFPLSITTVTAISRFVMHLRVKCYTLRFRFAVSNQGLVRFNNFVPSGFENLCCHTSSLLCLGLDSKVGYSLVILDICIKYSSMSVHSLDSFSLDKIDLLSIFFFNKKKNIYLHILHIKVSTINCSQHRNIVGRAHCS